MTSGTDPAPLDPPPHATLPSSLDAVVEPDLDAVVEPPLDPLVEALLDPGMLDQIRDVLAARRLAETRPDLIPDDLRHLLLDPELLAGIDDLLDAREQLTEPFLDLEAAIAERADQARAVEATAGARVVQGDPGWRIDRAWDDEGWTSGGQDDADYGSGSGVDVGVDGGDDLGSDVGEAW